MWKKVEFSWILIFCNSVISGYRILGVLPLPFKSHFQFSDALLQGLALNGNDVTIISPFNWNQTIPNYRRIHLERTQSAFDNGKTFHVPAKLES